MSMCSGAKYMQKWHDHKFTTLFDKLGIMQLVFMAKNCVFLQIQ